jgi:2-C-methyl-D-erythritol 2,4-cyclodiphosphate synthase
METPQAFPRDLIERAHARLQAGVTDDLAAVEALGEPVALVESMTPNPKLTRPADLALLESILARNTMTDTATNQTRTGFGYDIHRLQKGLPLVLGGVRIASEAGLVGHSDADVLSHAIADAILGACGLPDIGHYFPNTDAGIAGISSQEILRRARHEAKQAGMRLVHIDATLVAERPKIAPHIRRMKEVLAQTLQLQPADIGIKATTNEQLGAIGKGEGMAAQAVATLHGCLRAADQA